MEYSRINPEPSGPQPSKEDLLTQIEGDHLAASQAGDEARMEALDRRHQQVSAAKTDAQARKAYNAAVEEFAAAERERPTATEESEDQE